APRGGAGWASRGAPLVSGAAGPPPVPGIGVNAGAPARLSDTHGAGAARSAGVLQADSFAHVHAPLSAAEARAELAPGPAGPPGAPAQLTPAADASAPLVHESVEFRRLLTRAFLIPALLLALLAV